MTGGCIKHVKQQALNFALPQTKKQISRLWQVLCQKIIEHLFDTLTYINIMKLERLAASDASACLDESLAELCTSQILAVGTGMSWRRAAGSHFCPNRQQNNHACVGLFKEIYSKYTGNI